MDAETRRDLRDRIIRITGHYLYQTIDIRNACELAFKVGRKKGGSISLPAFGHSNVVSGYSDARFRTEISGHHHKPGDFVVHRSE